jgi:hypothetical protein
VQLREAYDKLHKKYKKQKVRKLEEADALLEEQKHRSAEFCEGNPNLLASPRTFLYLKRNYLILNELKDSPALCFEKLCLGAS